MPCVPLQSRSVPRRGREHESIQNLEIQTQHLWYLGALPTHLRGVKRHVFPQVTYPKQWWYYQVINQLGLRILAFNPVKSMQTFRSKWWEHLVEPDVVSVAGFQEPFQLPTISDFRFTLTKPLLMYWGCHHSSWRDALLQLGTLPALTAVPERWLATEATYLTFL